MGLFGSGDGISITGISGGGPQAMAALEKPQAMPAVRVNSSNSASEKCWRKLALSSSSMTLLGSVRITST